MCVCVREREGGREEKWRREQETARDSKRDCRW